MSENSWNNPWPGRPAIFQPQMYQSGYVDSCHICDENSPYFVIIDNGEGASVSICRDCIRRMDRLFDEPDHMEEWEAWVVAKKKKDEEFEARQVAREEARQVARERRRNLIREGFQPTEAALRERKGE